MAARHRDPKSEEQERYLLSEVVPRNTQYNTKWGVKVFRDWQETRQNKRAQLESIGFDNLDVTNVDDLTVPLEEMSAYMLNFWLCRFMCEVAKQNGQRYPPKSLYLLLCAINRHLSDVKGEGALNIFDKADRR